VKHELIVRNRSVTVHQRNKSIPLCEIRACSVSFISNCAQCTRRTRTVNNGI